MLLACMVLYMIWTVRAAMNERTEEDAEDKPSVAKCILFVVVGIVAIIWGGDLVVDSASAIAAALGLSETLIGLTIVAVSYTHLDVYKRQNAGRPPHRSRPE